VPEPDAESRVAIRASESQVGQSRSSLDSEAASPQADRVAQSVPEAARGAGRGCSATRTTLSVTLLGDSATTGTSCGSRVKSRSWRLGATLRADPETLPYTTPRDSGSSDGLVVYMESPLSRADSPSRFASRESQIGGSAAFGIL
jgi:hypothetical protein